MVTSMKSTENYKKFGYLRKWKFLVKMELKIFKFIMNFEYIFKRLTKQNEVRILVKLLYCLKWGWTQNICGTSFLYFLIDFFLSFVLEFRRRFIIETKKVKYVFSNLTFNENWN